ncbi:hypothetical protein [Cellulomonas chengniuliangii]|nr:hypothetical protein [Cellulomonas chengniuliangii]
MKSGQNVDHRIALWAASPDAPTHGGLDEAGAVGIARSVLGL